MNAEIRFGLQTKMPRGEFGCALAIMESMLDTPENTMLSSARRTNGEFNKRRKGQSVGI